MVTTRIQHYHSLSLGASEGYPSELSDVEPVVAPDEAFKPISARETVTRSYVHWVGSFDEMEEETDFLVEQGLFPCKIGKFGSRHE